MGKYKMPDGWENYTVMGNKVAGTCFLPFKVPLKEAILQRSPVSGDEWFTPSVLLQKVPNLKLVIDLTNTDRYYNIKDITDNGVFHEKIKCPGGGTLPPSRYLHRFYTVVDNFLRQYGNDHLIGVHCTHGLNRTGYFVCKYMVTKMGILPEQAIRDFQIARGHTMNRPVLINDILNISSTTRELRVENYFNNLSTSGLKSNKNSGNAQEIVNWRTKSAQDTPKFFSSQGHNNRGRKYEEKSSSSSFNKQRYVQGGYKMRSNVPRSSFGDQQQGGKRTSGGYCSRYFQHERQCWSKNDNNFPRQQNDFKTGSTYYRNNLNSQGYSQTVINKEDGFRNSNKGSKKKKKKRRKVVDDNVSSRADF